MKRLADYLQYMQAEDVLIATDRAKVEARVLLEDQGIAALALLLADLMADVIWQSRVDATDIAPVKSSVLS
jgi:hypothetical protein